MPELRIVVQHQIEQVVVIDVPEDELNNMSYEDALVNAQFDEIMPMSVVESNIVDVRVDGKEHYF